MSFEREKKKSISQQWKLNKKKKTSKYSAENITVPGTIFEVVRTFKNKNGLSKTRGDRRLIIFKYSSSAKNITVRFFSGPHIFCTKYLFCGLSKTHGDRVVALTWARVRGWVGSVPSRDL